MRLYFEAGDPIVRHRIGIQVPSRDSQIDRAGAFRLLLQWAYERIREYDLGDKPIRLICRADENPTQMGTELDVSTKWMQRATITIEADREFRSENPALMRAFRGTDDCKEGA